jgi:hypothetical protein
MREIPLKFVMIVIIAGFLLSVVPVSAVKTTEQSIGDSITLREPFYSEYYRAAEFILLHLAPAHLHHDR